MGPRPELFHPTYWYHRTYQIKVTCISPYGMDLVFMHHHLKTFNTFYCIGLSCCAKAAKLNSFFFFLSFLGWWIYLLVRIIIIIIIYRQGVGCVQSKFGVLNTMPRLGDLICPKRIVVQACVAQNIVVLLVFLIKAQASALLTSFWNLLCQNK